MNVDLLMPRGACSGNTYERRVFATAVGFSKSDTAVISEDLAARGGIDHRGIESDPTCDAVSYSASTRTCRCCEVPLPPA